MMTRLLSTRAFTLVEMMVVVAILGLLTAIAVPNYNTHRKKAIQAEAKNQLASIYSTMKVGAVDLGQFSPCLYQLGFAPAGSKRYYAVGFGGNPCQFGGDCTDAAGNVIGCGLYPYDCRATGVAGWTRFFGSDINYPTASLDASTAVHGFFRNTFTAFATGFFDGVPATQPDAWTIDHNRNLKNVTPGL